MGAGYYVHGSHPAWIEDATEGAIVDAIVADLVDGVGPERIRAGFIGEIGCSWPMTPRERRVLRAAGLAQKATGAPLMVHPGRDAAAPDEILRELSDVGADLERTTICHLERTVAGAGPARRACPSRDLAQPRLLRPRNRVLPAQSGHCDAQRRRPPGARGSRYRGWLQRSGCCWRRTSARSTGSRRSVATATTICCAMSFRCWLRAATRRATSTASSARTRPDSSGGTRPAEPPRPTTASGRWYRFHPGPRRRGGGGHRVSTLTGYPASKVEEVTMARVAWTGRLRPEKIDEYVEAHANVWPEMRAMISELGRPQLLDLPVRGPRLRLLRVRRPGGDESVPGGGRSHEAMERRHGSAVRRRGRDRGSHRAARDLPARLTRGSKRLPVVAETRSCRDRDLCPVAPPPLPRVV